MNYNNFDDLLTFYWALSPSQNIYIFSTSVLHVWNHKPVASPPSSSSRFRLVTRYKVHLCNKTKFESFYATYTEKKNVFRNLTAWVIKLLCSLAVIWQRILMYLLPGLFLVAECVCYHANLLIKMINVVNINSQIANYSHNNTNSSHSLSSSSAIPPDY